MRVLLIEDDREVAENIKDEIEKHYIVDVAYSGHDGSYLSQVNDYDAMVVDMALSDISGIELCRMTRAANINTPILMLAQTNDVSPKVSSLDSGADDCMSKPLSSPELLARLRALTRRQPLIAHSNMLCVGDLCLDLVTRTARRANITINLRRKEFDLLEYLMINKNRVVSKELILDHVWEQGIDVGSNTIEVHIRTLRRKVDRPFGKKSIKTFYNFGYKIVG